MNEADRVAPDDVVEVANIRVLRDQQHGTLVTALAEEYPELQAELDKTSHIPPLTPGTIIYGAEINSIGRAHFIHEAYGEPWYLPPGWFEIVG